MAETQKQIVWWKTLEKYGAEGAKIDVSTPKKEYKWPKSIHAVWPNCQYPYADSIILESESINLALTVNRHTLRNCSSHTKSVKQNLEVYLSVSSKLGAHLAIAHQIRKAALSHLVLQNLNWILWKSSRWPHWKSQIPSEFFKSSP